MLNKFVLTLATGLVIACSASGAEAFFGHCFQRGRSGCQPSHQRSMRTVCQPRTSVCQPQMAQHHVYSGNQTYGNQAYGNGMYSQPISQPTVGSGCVNCGTSGGMQGGGMQGGGMQGGGMQGGYQTPMSGQNYGRYPAASGGQRSYSPVGNLPIGL